MREREKILCVCVCVAAVNLWVKSGCCTGLVVMVELQNPPRKENQEEEVVQRENQGLLLQVACVLFFNSSICTIFSFL